LAYLIKYSPVIKEHLKELPVGSQRLVLEAIEQQLLHQPTMETRNRKKMRPNHLAPWELRVGTFRVYYDVEEPTAIVHIRAIGIKQRNRVRIGQEDFEL